MIDIEYCKEKYNNPHCLDEAEFLNDLRTLKYIKTYFRKYVTGSEINIDILLNHFIFLYNCFGNNIVEITFMDFEDYYYILLNTIYKYLGVMPDFININKISINSKDLEIDENLLKKLKTSKRNVCFT